MQALVKYIHEPYKSPDTSPILFYFAISRAESDRRYNGDAYLTVVYYGVTDVYIYNLTEKTGRWLSGITNLPEAYVTEIAEIQKLDADSETQGGQLSYYRVNDVVTISQKHGFALLRRSVKPGSWADGKYILKNLETGEENFICGSYIRKAMIISYMDEAYKWLDNEEDNLGSAYFSADNS